MKFVRPVSWLGAGGHTVWIRGNGGGYNQFTGSEVKAGGMADGILGRLDELSSIFLDYSVPLFSSNPTSSVLQRFDAYLQFSA